jgi:hypothetical protein
LPVDLVAGFGRRDLVILTLDALRWDVAAAVLKAGETPNLAALLGPAGWSRREAPGTFTLPSHEAIFAGFFPTDPADPGAARPVAVRFPGSRSVGASTLRLDAPCVIRGYRSRGYLTICVGGTSFFDPSLPLARGFTDRFERALFTREMGVASPISPRAQFDAAAEALAGADRPTLLFVNVSATHPPTRIFARGHAADSTVTQAAALRAVDRAIAPLIEVIRRRGGASLIVGADHGTCFGDDGRVGHRFAHPKVWEVPWAEVEVDP